MSTVTDGRKFAAALTFFGDVALVRHPKFYFDGVKSSSLS